MKDKDALKQMVAEEIKHKFIFQVTCTEVAAVSSARLWVAQRPTGPRTAGEARGRPSHPRRPHHLTRSSQHHVHGLRECWTPEPLRPLPWPSAPAWTPPSLALAMQAHSTRPTACLFFCFFLNQVLTQETGYGSLSCKQDPITHPF